MSKFDFSLFRIVWETVERKFAKETGAPFTLENLNGEGLRLKQADWDKIQKRFKLGESAMDINLSESAYKALREYLGVERLTDIDTISEQINRSDGKAEGGPIGFLGRKEELRDLNDFLETPQYRILELHGLPMIGKTELINYFLDKSEAVKKYKCIRVRFNPQPYDPESELSRVVFEERKFNDFSAFAPETLIVIENFQEVLKWAGRPKELHDIQDKYPGVRAFLQEAVTAGTVKLIIESRFKIHFSSVLGNVMPWPVKRLEIEGVKREEFWRFYRSKKFTRSQFETLCNNFNDHTGLLALAYNDDFVYDDLTDAVYRPKEATVYLWERIESIVGRLSGSEVLSLCALTLLKEPTILENLYEYLTPQPLKDEAEVEDSLRSLEKKLLIRVRKVLYDLNPYIREVCFTFLTRSREREMQVIANLPHFRTHEQRPIYNHIRQAQERGDYMRLITMGKELREAGRYDEALEAIEAGLPINPKPQYVLNEKAICYRNMGRVDEAVEIWNALKTDYGHLPAFRELGIIYRENNRIGKSIEILEEARGRAPRDVRTLTELAISYSDNKEYEKSIEVANRAIDLGDNFCYVVLANTYQRMGDLEGAYETARRGVNATGRNDPRLVKKLSELEALVRRPAARAGKPKPLRVFFSYSRRDKDMKQRIDIYLSNLKREGKIETWNDEKIPAGGEWEGKIAEELRASDIILLLITQDFIASEYIWKTELPAAMERHESKRAVVIPIICRAVDDFKKMPFARLNVLPRNAEPINSPENGVALSEVARGVRQIVEALLETKAGWTGE